MANYALTSIGLSAPRTELHEALALTSCEVSCNNLPANAAIPFVHGHKLNEEVYLFIKGSGIFTADGKEVAVKAGDCLKAEPECMRTIKAGAEGLSYFCIQAQKGSLSCFTMSDAIIAS